MADTLYASFADPSLAEQAAGALLDHGVKNEDISLVAGEQYGRTRYANHPAVASYTGDLVADDDDAEEAHENDPVAVAKHGITTTTGADAASGALAGAGVGLGIGTLAALA